jgi:tRNA pseudouridine55 synthase
MCQSEDPAGVVVVDKPAGMTSHDVVNVMRRLYGTRRVGHAGTLDPDATGVLVVCLGQATRLVEYLAAGRKSYVAGVRFGIETDTQDASGRVLSTRPAGHLGAQDVERALERFRGRIRQIPPMVSAVHHEGKRLYELARAGKQVEREAREIEIFRLELREFRPGEAADAIVEVVCSSGTYIRTLAADIGEAVGTGAHMSSLRRTWVTCAGERRLDVEQAFSLDALRQRAQEGRLSETILPMAEAVRDWPSVTLDEESLMRILAGQRLALGESGPLAALRSGDEAARCDGDDGSPVAVLDGSGRLAAVATISSGELRPVKVLIPR